VEGGLRTPLLLITVTFQDANAPVASTLATKTEVITRRIIIIDLLCGLGANRA
jgi:hypothetical protein